MTHHLSPVIAVAICAPDLIIEDGTHRVYLCEINRGLDALAKDYEWAHDEDIWKAQIIPHLEKIFGPTTNIHIREKADIQKSDLGGQVFFVSDIEYEVLKAKAERFPNVLVGDLPFQIVAVSGDKGHAHALLSEELFPKTEFTYVRDITQETVRRIAGEGKALMKFPA